MRPALHAAVLTLTASSVIAQAPVDEFDFKVNSGTTGVMFYSQIAAHPNGDFVVIWSALYGDTDGRLTGQRFGRDGQRRGGEFLIATSTPGFPRPAVSAAADGSVEVAWFTEDQATLQIFARRYDAAGLPGPVFRISPSTSTFDRFPRLATDSSGAMVVVWERVDLDGVGGNILARRLDAGGAPLGAEFMVNTSTAYRQGYPAVAYQPGGDFVVVWSQEGPDIDSAIFGQRFSTAGAPLGSEFEVARSTTRPQRGPSIAATPTGEFVVSWMDARVFGDAVDRLKTRRFSASGTPLGPERIAHLFAATDAFLALGCPLALSRGDVVTAWPHFNGRENEVRMRRFDASGVPRGPALDPGAGSVHPRWYPDLAADGSGRVVATWVAGGHDIRARRFGLMGPVALAVDPTAGGSSDGNGVLEPDEIVDLRPTWQNNDAVPRTHVGFLGEFTGPPGAGYLALVTNVPYPTFQPGAIQSPFLPYRVTLTAPTRPVVHWDAVAGEFLGPGNELTRWPVHVGESFTDVPRSAPFYRFAETLLHRGVTAGCEDGRRYCPLGAVTREQIAPFLLASREEPDYVPAACDTPLFADVPASSPFCRWVEELARRGVTSGCGGGRYCPQDAVTREQMAVFLLRTLDPALSPPACTTPVFDDVPASSPFCRWIEELVRRGVTAGCGGGNYCPAQAVTRGQMAVFLTTTFGLTLYGP